MLKSILFVCNQNSVRSPMAAALLHAAAGARLQVDSAGVHEGGLDPFAAAVLDEIGVGLTGHEPKALHALDLAAVDLAIALTPEAAGELRKILPRERIEFWDIENPSGAIGGRAAILDAYRAVRDALSRRLAAKFKDIYQKP